MSIVHIRSTTRGSGPVIIDPCPGSTQNTWKIRQVLIHCEVTFTDICTVEIQARCHEGSKYDTVFNRATVATAAGVIQDSVWLPNTPHCLVGKDRIAITFGTASALLPWAYDVAIEI